MRVTCHHGRGLAKHNNRHFDLENAPHIDQTKTRFNRYWTAGQGWAKSGTTPDFVAHEAEVYGKLFGEALKAQNERYKAKSQFSRIRELKDWQESKEKGVRETILQIGDREDAVELDEFWPCLRRYMNRLNEWNMAHGEPMRVFSVAVHVDETSIHAHVRYAFAYKDEKSSLMKPGMDKALEQAGIPLKDPSAKKGRYNNRQMVFDQMRRDLWIATCEEYQIEVEKEPDRNRTRHMPKAEFIDYAAQMDELAERRVNIKSREVQAAVQEKKNERQRKINVETAEKNAREAERLQRWERQLRRTGALANGMTLEPQRGPQSGLGR